MEYNIKITQCDICKRKVEATYSSLIEKGWSKIQYKKDWKSGIHQGKVDVDLCVCNKCDDTKLTMRIFLNKILTACRG